MSINKAGGIDGDGVILDRVLPPEKDVRSPCPTESCTKEPTLHDSFDSLTESRCAEAQQPGVDLKGAADTVITDVATTLSAQSSPVPVPDSPAETVAALPLGAEFPVDILRAYDTRTIGEALVQRVCRSERVSTSRGVVSAGCGQPESAVALCVEARHLKSIIRRGFLNQHQTGRSNASYLPEYRCRLEDDMVQLSFGGAGVGELDAKTRSIRPKYGMLLYELEDGFRPTPAKNFGSILADYGDIVAIFSDEVKSRTTHIPYDSLQWDWHAHRGDIGTFSDDEFHHIEPGMGVYHETQTWGELDAGDVAEWWVPANVDDATMDLLRSTGVPVYEHTGLAYNSQPMDRGDLLVRGDIGRRRRLMRSLGRDAGMAPEPVTRNQPAPRLPGGNRSAVGLQRVTRKSPLEVVRSSTVSANSDWTYRNALGKRDFEGGAGSLEPFDEDAILAGDDSLVSLGEGAATYIKSILQGQISRQKEAPRLPNVHAMDLIYDNPAEIFDPQTRQFVIDHPDNYHCASYQEFALQYPNGSPFLFNEVISSHGLTQMLDQQPELLESVVVGLSAPGGHLRIWPMYGDLYDLLRPFVESMLEARTISAHSSLDGGDVLTLRR